MSNFINTSKFQNLLSWSSARFSALQRCERRYFFTYIGGWGGWDSKAPEEVQAAYHHKYLTAPEQEVGLFVHDLILNIFWDARAGRHYSLQTHIKNAQTRFKIFLALSASRKLRDVTRTKRKLLRHELGQPLNQEEEAFLMHQIETLLQAFFNFADVQGLLKYPEDLLGDFLESGSFEIGHELGVPARPRTDAVWVTPESVVIADWKCGRRSSSHAAQALTYDIFVRTKLELPAIENVEVRFYYLADGEVVSYEFTDDERQERLWQIGEEFENLNLYSTDPKINLAPAGRFVGRVIKACLECPFQSLCPEYLKARASAPTKFVEAA